MDGRHEDPRRTALLCAKGKLGVCLCRPGGAWGWEGAFGRCGSGSYTSLCADPQRVPSSQRETADERRHSTSSYVLQERVI